MTTILHRWNTPADLQTWTTDAWNPSSTSDGYVLLRSPVVHLEHACVEVVPSWSAVTPLGTWIELRLRACINNVWTTDYWIGRWDSLILSRRTSFRAQRDEHGCVATDTLILNSPASAVQADVLLCSEGTALPQLRSLTLACSSTHTAHSDTAPSGVAHELSVPHYSQYAYVDGDGWCSPTALTMVLGYWYQRTSERNLVAFSDAASIPDRVAPGVYDPEYEGYGNWSFNVAYAAALGLEGFVTRLDNLEQVEYWTNAEVPVVASIAWNEGQLDHAPIARSSGHLLVITGFTGSGDVVVADPAGAVPESVRRIYKRDQFAACWLRPRGTVYVIYPPGWDNAKG